MHDTAHSRAITALAGVGSLRVWSLLVTVFGDLAPDAALDGPSLSAILAQIGVKPEAGRVALHRLRGDGWIASRKTGRTSVHSLTPKGQGDSAAARPRIYARPENCARTATVWITRDDEATLDPGIYARIAPRLFIAPTGAPPPDRAMALTPEAIPTWIGAQIEPETLRNGYGDLHAVLRRIDADLPDGTALSPLHVAALRVMIVHGWRRLCLKHPDLPRDAHSAQWRGHDCRVLVTALLDRFPPPALDRLETG